MSKPLDFLVVSSERDNRTSEIIIGLDKLRDKGLVDKIVVLDSDQIDRDYIIPGVKDKISKIIKRDRDEGIKRFPEEFKIFKEDIYNAVKQEGIDKTLAICDIGTYAVSQGISKKSNGIPSFEVIDFFQNKSKTYEFMRNSGIAMVPNMLDVSLPGLKDKEYDVRKFIEENDNKVFAKPSSPDCGGAQGAAEINDYKTLVELMKENSRFSDYMVSEFLNEPEYNHTVIINPNGKISTQGTYYTDLGTSDKNARITGNIDELNVFGEKFGKQLVKDFRGKDILGVYNVDFLKRKNGDYVLSEINPGRFPAGMGIFRKDGVDYNQLEALVGVYDGKNEKYNKDFISGVKYTR